MRTGQDHQAAGYCWVIHDGGEAYSVGLIDCNAREGVGTGDREYRALRGHLSGQTPVDNVMNDLESVNFIQSKNAGA